jgi:carbon-monoxide dehydrogenase medium subunit
LIIDYVLVKSLSETLAAFVKNSGKAKIVAGGTDTFSQLALAKRGVVIVDISRVEDLHHIDFNEDHIEIGAAVVLSRLLNNSKLLTEVPALVEAVSRVGSPQIRNQGTVVGNILTGIAVSNVKVSTASMGAFLKVRGPDHERIIEIDKLGANESKLKNDEIAVSLVIPRCANIKASAYGSFAPRKGFSYASASVSASVALDGKKFSRVSLVASPILPSPKKATMKPCKNCGGTCRICQVVHLSQLEQDLEGRPAREEEIKQVCNMYDWESAPLRNSYINGTSDYRQNLLKVLSKRVLVSALHRYQEIHQPEMN